MSEEEAAASTWVTVAQAAAALGVSERAIQKRCKAGKIAARRLDTPQGTRWEVDANELTRTGEPIGRERTERPPEPNTRTGEPLSQIQTNHAQNHANARTEQDANEPANHAPDFAAHLLEENRFLRGVVEQQQRDAAELRAALREALKMSTRALAAAPSVEQLGEVGREVPQVLTSSPEAQERPREVEGAQVDAQTARGALGAPERAGAASTWERSRGLRGWLLRMLRG